MIPKNSLARFIATACHGVENRRGHGLILARSAVHTVQKKQNRRLFATWTTELFNLEVLVRFPDSDKIGLHTKENFVCWNLTLPRRNK